MPAHSSPAQQGLPQGKEPSQGCLFASCQRRIAANLLGSQLGLQDSLLGSN
jgi:hypothetical protein